MSMPMAGRQYAQATDVVRRSAAELSTVISRALITASIQMGSSQAWTPSLELTLHRLGCRELLSAPLVARVIDPFLLHHHSLAFGFFNWASQQPGYSQTAATYESVFKALCFSRQFSSMDKLLKQVRVQKIPLKPSVYGSIIASFVAGKKTRLAFTVFCEFVSDASLMPPNVCNSLLACLSSEGSTESAYKVLDEMINRGARLNTLGFGVFLWRVSKKAELEEIFTLIDRVGKVDFSCINGSIIALLVVHGLCVNIKTADAVWALEELRKRGCKPDFMAYRVVAEVLREGGNAADVEIILKKKRKLGVAPRTSDYTEFIFQLVSERLMHEAKELGEIIVAGNFPIEDDVLNVLIGSASTADPARAVYFFKFMLEKETTPTLLTLKNLCENLCKHEEGDELVSIFQLLSKKEYFKNLENYNVMISFLCKARKVREAYEVVQEMKKKGFEPNVSSYNPLIEACCHEDLIRPAKRLWDEMFTSGCDGDLETYNILIQKFSEIGQVEEARHLYNLMLSKGLEPNENIYIPLLDGLCRSKNPGMAIEVFNKSIVKDVTYGNTLLNSFIRCLCREGFISYACKLLQSFPCELRFVESHLTFVKYLVENGETVLASQHTRWVAYRSPELLHAIQTELSAMLSSSSNQDPVLWLLTEIRQVLQVHHGEEEL